jgi:osmotically-inducible protein OsmY
MPASKPAVRTESTAKEETMSDIALRQNILSELEFEPSLDAVNIGVAVKDGIVTLTGHVASYAERAIAEQVVGRIKSVRAIAQEIEVRLASNKKTADDQIAKRALKIIAWDTTIPNDKIRLKVENGWVTLSGDVEWNFHKKAAEESVRKLSGVFGVTNLITVRPRANISDVQHRIEEALKRSAEIDAGRIRITVADGKVTLLGKVHAWHERGVAERAAWSAPGVTAVEDRIQID